MQPPIVLPPDCCHHVALAPKHRHHRAPTSRTCHSRAAMTPTAASSSSCLHCTPSSATLGHHRATIAPPSLYHTRGPPCFLASENRAPSFTSLATTIASALASPAAANASSAASFSRHHQSYGNHHEFTMEATTSSSLHLRPRRAHVRTASTPFTSALSSTTSLPWQPPRQPP